MRLAFSYKSRAHPIAFSKLTKSQLLDEPNEILHFIRQEMPEIIGKNDFKVYFGKYADQPQNFVFEEGDVDCVLEIVEWVADKLRDEGKTCFSNILRKLSAAVALGSSELIQDQNSSRCKIIRQCSSPQTSGFSQLNSSDEYRLQLKRSAVVAFESSEIIQDQNSSRFKIIRLDDQCSSMQNNELPDLEKTGDSRIIKMSATLGTRKINYTTTIYLYYFFRAFFFNNLKIVMWLYF